MRKFDKLLFGSSGIPMSTPEKGRNTLTGIGQMRTLGLEAMELAFVHSVNITEEKAPEVKAIAEKNNIALTCHAPYYINLNAQEAPKIHATINRVVKSTEILQMCGGWSVVFHPGFYMQQPKEKAYAKVKETLQAIMKACDDKGIDKVWIRPETMGNASKFGTLEETIRLSQEIDRVLPCIDYGHLHAREGKYNTKEEFDSVLEKLEEGLGKEVLKNMHIQAEGVEYTEKGERRHITFDESDLKWKDMVQSWKDFKIRGIVISESANVEVDAQKMKEYFESL